jgi:branched-subunit amino acid aminotransferase/4-amino-4-deoxychorismate lyase
MTASPPPVTPTARGETGLDSGESYHVCCTPLVNYWLQSRASTPGDARALLPARRLKATHLEVSVMATEQTVMQTSAPATAQGHAWIDGEYVPIAEARIPILDTGFVWSDLTYDVVGVWEGKFFRLEDHLDRFEKACRTVRLELPLAREQIKEILTEVVRRSGIKNAYVSMTLTRGVPSPGERDPRKFRPRFYAYAIPYIWIVQPEQQQIGTSIIVARDVRRTPPGAIHPTAKNYQWGDFIRGLFEAYDRDAWLPVLTDGDGNITEGPGFNVFVVADGQLYTPARGVLLGITRQTALDIAAEEGLQTHVEEVPTSMLYRADEIFLTSTGGGIVPVATVDHAPVKARCPGPITTLIRDKYWAWHDDPRFATAVAYDE